MGSSPFIVISAGVTFSQCTLHALWPVLIREIDLSKSNDIDLSSLTSIALRLHKHYISQERDKLEKAMGFPFVDTGVINDEFFEWQSTSTWEALVRQLDVVKNLDTIIRRKCSEFLRSAGADYTEERLSVSAWFAVLGKDEYHAPHTHTGELCSGVLYLSTPDSSGDLVLFDPRGSVPPFGEYRNIKPMRGKLVLFPSWLQHMVMPTLESNDQRVVVAMNVRGLYLYDEWHHKDPFSTVTLNVTEDDGE